MKLFRNIMIAVFLVTSFAPAFAAPVHWQHLATRTVKLSADRDTLHIGKDEGIFVRLKLGVQKNPVFINKVHIHYSNGDVQTVSYHRRFKKGDVVTLDLKGNRRFIDKVVLNYTTARPKTGRAQVQIWGVSRV
jgi:hypothetical protein